MNKGAAVCGGIVVALTLILSLTLSSFKTFKDSEVCLVYDVHTRIINSKMISDPGFKHIGLTKRTYCFPKELQTLEFSAGDVVCAGASTGAGTLGSDCVLNFSGAQKATRKIETRTYEGLNLFLEMSVSYRLNPELLRETFFLFGPGTSYQKTYQAVGRAVIRNIASSFSATQFLSGDRSSITTAMLAALVPALEELGAAGIENLAFLGQPMLPGDFEQAINDVRSASLEVKQAEEQREVTVINMYREGNTTLLNAMAEADAVYTSTLANRDKSLADRTASLITKKGAVDKAILQLETKLLEATNNAVVQLTTAQSVAEAKLVEANSLVTVLNTNSVSEVSVIGYQTTASVAIQTAEKEADQAAFEALQTDLGLSAAEVAHFVYLDTLQGQSQATWYLDHTTTVGSSGPLMVST